MKPFKLLGLAALTALTAMAFAGVSTAMAESTALCKEDAVELTGGICPEAQRISHVHGVSLKKTTLLSTLDTILCDVLSLGDVTSANNLGSPLEILGQSTFSNCEDHEKRSCSATETSAHGLVKVLKLGHELVSVTGEAEVLVQCGAFIHCKYNGIGLEGHGLGPLLSEEKNGEGRIEEQVVNKVSGFLCPKTAKIDGLGVPLEVGYITS